MPPDPAPLPDPGSEQDRRWYVAHVFTGKERLAEWHIRNQGLETFCPREIRTVRHARRLSTREKAFFPGYVFLRFDPGLDQWRSVNGTRGVRSLIMQAERPVPCPRGLVERLIGACDENGVVDDAPRLTPGQKVRVRSGPFAELVGTLERMDGPGRARVLLEIMSGQTAVRMDVRGIEGL